MPNQNYTLSKEKKLFSLVPRYWLFVFFLCQLAINVNNKRHKWTKTFYLSFPLLAYTFTIKAFSQIQVVCSKLKILARWTKHIVTILHIFSWLTSIVLLVSFRWAKRKEIYNVKKLSNCFAYNPWLSILKRILIGWRISLIDNHSFNGFTSFLNEIIGWLINIYSFVYPKWWNLRILYLFRKF